MSAPRSGFLLRVLVTSTGACVLIIEVLATRILAPHFGSSLFTLSSVLGVTLGALSLGYYYGGMLADHNPSWRTFGTLLTLAGLTTILIWPLSVLVLPMLAGSLRSSTGPLLASVVLFLVPCAILGAFSPYAVALEKRFAPGFGAGRAAGNIFFWSTIGSIAGSIAAGFLLIPLLGIRTLIAAVGIALLIIGIVITLLNEKERARSASLILVAMLTSSFALAVPSSTHAVFAVDGLYQHIAVTDMMLDGQPVRILWQDRNASSGIPLENDDHAFRYTRSIAAAWADRPPPRRSLVIGAGAFMVPRTIAEASPQGTVDVVDIEPGLEKIAVEYFRYEPSPRVRSIIADGRTTLRDNGQYDLIMGDAYQATHSIPAHLTTQEFFRMTADHLTDEGMFVGNFIGSTDLTRYSYLPAAMRTLLTVFPNGRFYAMEDPKRTAIQNVIFIACKSGACIAPCSSAFKNNPDPILSTLCEREVPVRMEDLTMHPMLTDDYAPVEWLAVRNAP